MRSYVHKIEASFHPLRRFNGRRRTNLGDLIEMAAWRRAHRGAAIEPVPATFWCDPACPFTYLAAERVEQLFAGAAWRPVAPRQLDRRELALVRAAAENRAVALRLPLIWPDLPRGDARPLARAAQYARERGVAVPFMLAASRLAYCGGFDPGDLEVVAEAAAAAGLDVDVCLAAAAERGRDDSLDSARRRLAGVGAADLPVLEVGGRLFYGEERLSEAAAARASAG